MLADFLFAIPVDGGRFGGFPIFAALSRFLFQFLVELTSLVGGPVLGAVAAGCGAGAGWVGTICSWAAWAHEWAEPVGRLKQEELSWAQCSLNWSVDRVDDIGFSFPRSIRLALDLFVQQHATADLQNLLVDTHALVACVLGYIASRQAGVATATEHEVGLSLCSRCLACCGTCARSPRAHAAVWGRLFWRTCLGCRVSSSRTQWRRSLLATSEWRVDVRISSRAQIGYAYELWAVTYRECWKWWRVSWGTVWIPRRRLMRSRALRTIARQELMNQYFRFQFA